MIYYSNLHQLQLQLPYTISAPKGAVIWCICPTVFLKNPRPGFLRWWRLVGLAMLCLSMLGSQCIFPQEDARWQFWVLAIRSISPRSFMGFATSDMRQLKQFGNWMPFLLIRIHEFITHHPVVQDLASQAPLEILQESVSSHIYSLAKIHLFLLEMERSKPLNLLFWGQYSNVSSAWGWLASACLWKSRALDYIDLGSFATDFGILSFGIHFGRESEWTAYSTKSFVLDIITVRIVGISFALNIWLYGVCFLWFACHLISRFLDVLSAHP